MSRRSQQRRFNRQFKLLQRLIPRLAGALEILRRDSWRPLRLPLSILLIAGGLLSVLPLLGIWMLPAGLLMLSLDVPALRAPVSAAIIRARRRLSLLRRWWQRRRGSRRDAA